MNHPEINNMNCYMEALKLGLNDKMSKECFISKK